LSALAALREPVDAFFADVMVMADDAGGACESFEIIAGFGHA
jgi:glycyl-tRNA synthetase beta subunit